MALKASHRPVAVGNLLQIDDPVEHAVLPILGVEGDDGLEEEIENALCSFHPLRSLEHIRRGSRAVGEQEQHGSLLAR